MIYWKPLTFVKDERGLVSGGGTRWLAASTAAWLVVVHLSLVTSEEDEKSTEVVLKIEPQTAKLLQKREKRRMNNVKCAADQTKASLRTFTLNTTGVLMNRPDQSVSFTLNGPNYKKEQQEAE